MNQTIEPSSSTPSHKLVSFNIPLGSYFTRIGVAGFNEGGRIRLTRATLYIDGQVVDVQTSFLNVDSQPLGFLGGTELRAYALVRSTVRVDLVCEIDSTGTVELTGRGYEFAYNYKCAVTYNDMYLFGGRIVKLVYMDGMAILREN